MAIFPPESVRDTSFIARVAPWPRERLVLEGARLNRSKSQALLAGGITLEDLSEIQRQGIATIFS